MFSLPLLDLSNCWAPWFQGQRLGNRGSERCGFSMGFPWVSQNWCTMVYPKIIINQVCDHLYLDICCSIETYGFGNHLFRKPLWQSPGSWFISLGSSDIQVFGMTCAVLGGRGSHGKTLALAPGTLCWACVGTSVSNLETIRIVKLYYNWQQ